MDLFAMFQTKLVYDVCSEFAELSELMFMTIQISQRVHALNCQQLILFTISCQNADVKVEINNIQKFWKVLSTDILRKICGGIKKQHRKLQILGEFSPLLLLIQLLWMLNVPLIVIVKSILIYNVKYWLKLIDHQQFLPSTKSQYNYLPLRVGVSPNVRQTATDISRDAITLTTALNANPHLDLTISILPENKRKYVISTYCVYDNNNNNNKYLFQTLSP